MAPGEVRRRIGYMPDHAGVYDRITVREYLEFFADAFRVESPEVVDAVLELTDLSKLQEKLVVTMSKGMKQRLQLARVLLHDPKILILDEPASDLDPRARIEIRDLLLELRSLGKTIFLSSHILTELADVCTSVAILEKGRVVVAGPINEIAGRLSQAQAQVRSGEEGVVPTVAQRRVKLRVLGAAENLGPLLQGASGVLQLEFPSPQTAVVTYAGDDAWLAGMIRHLVVSGAPIIGVEPERTELERIFLEATRGDLQ
jgi:ABC-2 type transport system ATP-binding protein